MTTNATNVQVPEGYVYVCEAQELPTRGKKTVHVGDHRVLIVACEAGYYAIEDRCPQTGGSIAHGEVLGCTLTTPTTGARYSLRTGRYLGGGQGWLPANWLTVWPLRTVEGKVYVRPPQKEDDAP